MTARLRKRLAIASAVLLVVSIFGLGGSMLLNSVVFDKYDAYGEVPVPGTGTLHLPAGDVKVSFHTEIAGTMEGGGLPIPQNLEVAITPSSGSAKPTFTQNLGGTDADNQDARVQVGVAHVPATGNYTVTTDGKASAFISPRGRRPRQRLRILAAAVRRTCRGQCDCPAGPAGVCIEPGQFRDGKSCV